MHAALAQRQSLSLLDDAKTYRKLELNHRRNKKQDHTAMMDAAQAAFRYEDCKDEYWNPVEFSLLHGTPLWEQASPAQRVLLNQLYWVAYYAQIISARIATHLFQPDVRGVALRRGGLPPRLRHARSGERAGARAHRGVQAGVRGGRGRGVR